MESPVRYFPMRLGYPDIQSLLGVTWLHFLVPHISQMMSHSGELATTIPWWIIANRETEFGLEIVLHILRGHRQIVLRSM